MKCIAITFLVLAVIGGLFAMGLTIQFSSSGWLNQVAFPALRKFFEMKADLTIGEGLAYIAAPILGGGIVLALIYKYAIPCIKEMLLYKSKKLLSRLKKIAKSLKSRKNMNTSL